MRDFNAKVGKKLDENEDEVGLNGEGKRNDRGQTLIKFAIWQNTMITNSFFKAKPSRK